MPINKYVCERTYHTPLINFDPVTGNFELTGKSIPENTALFYKPFFEWLDEYIKSPAPKTTLNIQLDYFNTSSSKSVFDTFKKLQQLHAGGKSEVIIYWLFNINDEDMQEAGEGGSAGDVGYGIALDNFRNVHTAGYFNGTADFDPSAASATIVSAGSTDFFISKLDSAGSYVWAKGMGGTGADVGYSLALHPTGNVYSTGSFAGTADFDPYAPVVNLTSAGSNDVFVHKMDFCTNTFSTLTVDTCVSYTLNNQTYTSSNTYTQVIPNAAGCDSTITLNLTIYSVSSSIVSQTNVGCYNGNDGAASVLASGGIGSYTYSWSPSGGTQSAAIGLSAQVYGCTITDSNGCTALQNVTITEPSETQPVAICLVTVDTLSTHNIIYWEKPVTTFIDTFFVYREVTTNNYVKIASVPYDSLNEYHDYAADPNTQSFKYKMAVLDTCGYESGLSDYHNTIHLQDLGGGNLQWTLYDIENAANPVIFYRVYRDDIANGNFQPISITIPGGNFTYTDPNAGSFPTANYVVDVTWNISCTPYRTTVSTTRSNLRVQIPIGLNEELEKQISVYPNPASQLITIEISNSINILNFKIYNVLGEVVYDDASFEKAKKQINVEGFAKGVYTVDVETENGSVMKKLIVQ